MFVMTFILLTVECVHSLVLSLRDSHVCYDIYITYNGMCSFFGSVYCSGLLRPRVTHLRLVYETPETGDIETKRFGKDT